MMQSTAPSLQLLEEDEVLAGLSAPRKRLPCRLLYDARGAELFEAITALDAYYLWLCEPLTWMRARG